MFETKLMEVLQAMDIIGYIFNAINKINESYWIS